ncbi:putative toxin-antitoxin system toxin component, PIN family [Thermoanaerobacterium thermosaccharolyticum]|uniref:putative toxin-antitoxin system toxin component, PIN family n=2 Tax=Thermoanaerobacterium thermosaccharolyticum TaxID=1517 RepID=UPI0010CEB88E|nr:putative toxin-antitoxin system toxin component, PIN family [Thermoanaerobacterium thermosaccharolyticum]MCP2241213.1 putative PIN family toxin of toxin-antitoxin system [Thermoanaerobacterium thermosaccharolyticum]TCW30870.1 putative PIN family toxin of toxin-antitoxin system [Thermohydrogenium kirishiense]
MKCGKNAMRITVDTNILISAFLFPKSSINDLMITIAKRHKLILSSFVIDETVDVVKRKFKGKEGAIDNFLSKFPYEMVYTPQEMKNDLFKIRDERDYPILYTAIMEDVDILITGDKDFSSIDIEKPEILTPAQFLEKYS